MSRGQQCRWTVLIGLMATSAAAAAQPRSLDELRAQHETSGHVIVHNGKVDDHFAKARFPLPALDAARPKKTPRTRNDVAGPSASALFAKLGTQANGTISRASFKGGDFFYEFLDVDNRGYVSLTDVSEFLQTAPFANARRKARRMVAKLDANRDGLLSKDELSPKTAAKWLSCDENHDARLSRLEIARCYSAQAKARRAATLTASDTRGVQRKAKSAPFLAAAPLLQSLATIDWACVLNSPWRADYFALGDYKAIEKDPTIKPYASECLFTLNRDYSKKPMPPSSASEVVVRYTGPIDLPANGIYELAYRFDGKAILKVDGALLPPLLGPTAEAAYGGATPKYAGTFKWSLSPGKHTVTAYYFGIASPGFASLAFKLIKEQPVPAPAVVCKDHQWKASFYNPTSGALLGAKPALVRCDDAIDFQWTPGTSPGPGVKGTDWIAKWTRNLGLSAGQSRQFELSSYPAATVIVDAKPIVDNLWSSDAAGYSYGSYTASAGKSGKAEVQFSTAGGSSEEAWRLHVAVADCKNPFSAGCAQKDIVHVPINDPTHILSSRRLIETIDLKVDTMKDKNDPTGSTVYPHKVDYTWKFYGGANATSVRFHFKKFKLVGVTNKLVLSSESGSVAQTLTGYGPIDGWSAPVFGDVANLRLVTDGANQSSGGFAIDTVEVSRVDQADTSVKVLDETNREWSGLVKPGATVAYAIALGDGLHDFFVQMPKGSNVDLCVREGLVEPKFVSCVGAAVGPQTSKVVSLDVAGPHYYTVIVKNKGPKVRPYTFMVNRVANVFDVEVEFDWTVPGNKIGAKKCQLEELFRRSSERFYGVTDGFMRFGKVKYWLQTCTNEMVDVTFYENDAIPVSSIFWGTQADDVKMFQNQLRHYADGEACAAEPGDKSGQGASSFLVHEWGHYAFWLGDEYLHNAGGGAHQQCPHSLMSMGWNHQYEFCTALTHLPNPGPGTSILSQGKNSVWSSLHDDTDVPERKLSPSPHVFEPSAIGETVVFDQQWECP